jgi:hypothetical protein
LLISANERIESRAVLLENDKREPWTDNLAAMRHALEDAGVEFIPARSGKGVGVRLRGDC